MLPLLIDQDLDHVSLRGLLLRVPNLDVMTAHEPVLNSIHYRNTTELLIVLKRWQVEFPSLNGSSVCITARPSAPSGSYVLEMSDKLDQILHPRIVAHCMASYNDGYFKDAALLTQHPGSIVLKEL